MFGIVIDSDASAICISVLRSFSWHHGIRSKRSEQTDGTYEHFEQQV